MGFTHMVVLSLLVSTTTTASKMAASKAAAPATKPANTTASAVSNEKVFSKSAIVLANTSASLAFDLYQNMAKEKDLENILISPVVVASSLGLVALGGKASTAEQATSLLGGDQVKNEQVHSALTELLTEVSNTTARNITWIISNHLYGPSSVKFTDDFVKRSRKHYNYDHSKVNFKDKNSAVKAINEWATKSTKGKLTEVTKELEDTDGAIIVNAMFFKPHWNEQFHPKMVDDRVFLVSPSFTVSIPMMHRTGLYGFHEDAANQLYILSMPLAHKMSSVVFIMPYHVEPLDRVEKLLTPKQLDTWLGKLEETAVAVSLPKISIEVSHNLQKHLGQLGLTEAVNKTTADLSNISGKKDLYLSNLFHASAIEWGNEGNPIDHSIFGTEKFKNPKLFYVDHPFMFVVKDHKTSSILFIGRLVRPKGNKMRDEL